MGSEQYAAISGGGSGQPASSPAAAGGIPPGFGAAGGPPGFPGFKNENGLPPSFNPAMIAQEEAAQRAGQTGGFNGAQPSLVNPTAQQQTNNIKISTVEKMVLSSIGQ